MCIWRKLAGGRLCGGNSNFLAAKLDQVVDGYSCEYLQICYANFQPLLSLGLAKDNQCLDKKCTQILA